MNAKPSKGVQPATTDRVALFDSNHPEVFALPVESARIAIEAVWESEALLQLLIDNLDNDPEHLGLRGIAIRAHSLNGAVMSALDDQNISTDALAEKAFGRRLYWPARLQKVKEDD